MTARIGREAAERRWWRGLIIAVAALILASCRSIGGPSVSAAPSARAGAVASTQGRRPDPPPPEAVRAAGDVVQVGWQVPAATGAPGCPPAAPGRGPCRDGRCGAGACRDSSCGRGSDEACVTVTPRVPRVAPCLVCDGGDAGAPAMPVARHGLKNLTSGDTVARYRAADDGPDGCDVHITASNCTCVYAPRFGSVRQVTRPHEDARPLGPRGFAADTAVEAEVDLQPVCRAAQSVAPEAARKALPGVAVEERLGPLAVDQGHLVHESDGLLAPAEDVLEDRLERADRVQSPRLMVGFDVPVAWTCVRAAMVTVGSRKAEVVSAGRGTATLRLESPGRAELTLCKRAGSDTARAGEELDFTIYFLNSGDRALADIVLADALPGRLELVPGSAAANLTADFSTQSGEDGSVVLTWRLADSLKPGEGGFVRFRTLVR